jgi:phosphoribosylanthranilate isomerase
VLIQIYGLTTVEDAALVAASGAHHAGVVLDEGFATWDQVDEPTTRAIAAELRAAGTVKVVGLSLATDADAIRRTLEIIEPDIAHIVRLTEEWEPDAVARLREQIAPVQLMLTIGVRDPTAVDVATRFAAVADSFLLDTAHPDTGVVGATGVVHDWGISHAIVTAVDIPVILAGGLGPENVVEAISAVQPAGVDSETRTSRSDDRRRKDPEKVRQFVAAVRGSAG